MPSVEPAGPIGCPLHDFQILRQAAEQFTVQKSEPLKQRSATLGFCKLIPCGASENASA